MKKIMLVLLSAMMIFSVLPVAAAAQSVSIDEEIALLQALDILPDGISDNLKEFVKSRDFISYAEKLGYTGETAEGEEFIAYKDAAAIMVNTLSYGALAQQYGGYPSGYMRVAQQIGLLSGINGAQNEALTNYQAAKLLYNALQTDAVNMTVSDGNLKLNREIGNELLGSRFDTVRYTGVVTGTEQSKLMADGKSFKNKLEIDGYTYNMPLSVETNSMLGKRVYFYVRFEKGSEDLEDGEIILINPLENTVLTVQAESIRKSSTLGRLDYYTEDGKKEKENISSDAVVFYNGVRTYAATDADMSPPKGDVTIIDNDDDGSFDYVLINSYKTYVTDSVSGGVITVKYSGESFDFAKNEKYRIFSGNAEVTANEAEEWDVLKVMQSKEKDALFAEIVRNTVSGTAEAVNETDGEEYVTIAGVQYRISEEYITQSETLKSIYAPAIKKGITATFILDGKNKIVGVRDEQNMSMKYGWLVKAAYKDSLIGTLQFKIFELNGAMSVYDPADNLIVDGKAAKTAQAVETAFGGSITPQLIMYRLNASGKIAEIDTAVDLSVNADGKSGYDRDEFSLDAKLVYSGGSSRPQWQSHTDVSGGTFFEPANIRVSSDSDWIRISPDGFTPLFYIPYGGEEDEYMFFRAHSDFYMFSRDTDIYVYDTVKYDENEPFKKLSAIVLVGREYTKNPWQEGTGGAESNTTNQYRHSIVVKKTEKVLDEKGEERIRVFGITYDKNTGNNGAYERKFNGYFTDNAYNLDDYSDIYGNAGVRPEDLKEGDVIHIGYKNPLASKLEINRYYVVARAEKYTDPANDGVYKNGSKTQQPTDATSGTIVGEVVYSNGQEFIIATKNFRGETVCYCLLNDNNNSKYYAYNDESGILNMASRHLVQKGVRVAMISGTAYITTAIIME